MTRQRRLKRRIRARMARTGERYATARRQVLRRLGNGAPVADQPEVPEARPARWHRKRIGAVGLVLAVAAVAVVVISRDGEGPKQPSSADELPASLRVQLGQDLNLDRVRSVECRAPADIPRDRFNAGPACRIEVGGPADIVALKSKGEFKSRDEWQILRAVPAPRLRRWASVNRSSIERAEDDIRKLAQAQRATSLFHRASAAYGEVYSTIR